MGSHSTNSSSDQSCSDQGFTPQIARDATRWFYIAGIIALGFAYALFRVDEGLTHSTRERDLANTLKELRTAQRSIPTGETDTRLSSVLPPVAADETAADREGRAVPAHDHEHHEHSH